MIVEPEGDGHHIVSYARKIAKSVLNRGWQLQLLTTKATIEHPSFKIFQNDIGENFQTFLMPHVLFPKSNLSTFQLIKYQLNQFDTIRSEFKAIPIEQQPDAIYVINFDYMDKAMSLRGSPFGNKPFAGMLMSLNFHHHQMRIVDSRSRNDFLYKILLKRLLNNSKLVGFTTIDASFFEYLNQNNWRNRKKARYLPDPIPLKFYNESYKQSREILGIEEDKFVVLVYGALSKRKGISQLIEVLNDIKCPTSVIVLLAGKQNNDIQNILASPKAIELKTLGRIIEMRGFLDDKQEFQAFKAADVVWLGYDGFSGMSGVLVSAAAMGLPVVACQTGVIGWMTKKYKLGEIVEVNDREQIINAIINLFNNGMLRKTYGEMGLKMALMHSEETFGESICEIFEHM